MDLGKSIFPGLILLSLASALACSGGLVSDPAAARPDAASKIVYDWHDDSRDRALPTSVWYPARLDGTEDWSHAPYPLILFSQ